MLRIFDEATSFTTRYRHTGGGVMRAVKRLEEKREANKKIPDTEVYTRQQARAEKRAIMKQRRSMRRVDAMQSREHGGAAAVR